MLSDAEESALAKWVTRQSAAGFPITPALLKESAQEILNQRMRRASFQDPDPDHDPNLPPQLPIIGQEWLYRFQTRHSNLVSIHSNSLDSSRFREANPVNINAWFNAYQLQNQERKYEPQNTYNMDETGFAIGSTQSNRILVDSTQKVHWKSSPGRQEWVTVIECIDACGGDTDLEIESIPPMIIFKAKNTNSS